MYTNISYREVKYKTIKSDRYIAIAFYQLTFQVVNKPRECEELF
jgi:hypothetical protein